MLGIIATLVLTPRFGHAGDPGSEPGGLQAATHVPASHGPLLAVWMAPEPTEPKPQGEGVAADGDGPKAGDWVEPLARRLGGLGVVEVLSGDAAAVEGGASAASAYDIEVGVRAAVEQDAGGQLLRVRVLSKERQVLLGFRVALEPSAEDALERAADRLGAWFAGRDWTSSVASVQDGRVTIYGGRRHLVEPGLTLRAIGHRPVFDESGRRLGHASAPVASLRVVSVDEGTAVAEILSGEGHISAGTEVVIDR
ncbi:MAG: hypothetical protein AAGF23_01590 [Acidobacteriota bacterium]